IIYHDKYIKINKRASIARPYIYVYFKSAVNCNKLTIIKYFRSKTCKYFFYWYNRKRDTLSQEVSLWR
ncbi:MAG: hypothetical protein FWC53_03950, partial [Firmicutes bacterium]|nr:hypothetical protein [Bacillota bacterium]